jgi:hypothetical protein
MEMNGKHMTHRVITFLTREELDFLDQLEKDIMFSTGMHISRSKIIENLTELLARSKMRASGVKSHDELKMRMLEAIAQENLELQNKKEA